MKTCNRISLKAVLTGMACWASTGIADYNLVIDGSETYSVAEDVRYSNHVRVGEYTSDNHLLITNAVMLDCYCGYIGRETNSIHNTALVSGAGAVWSSDLIFMVGYYGPSNSLTISNGGRVEGQSGYVGGMPGSSNCCVVVSDSGSVWTNAGSVTVGRYGIESSLTITNGGSVAATDGILGSSSNSYNNVALITGTNSSWTLSEEFYAGYLSDGNGLTVNDGALLKDVDGYIGYNNEADSNRVVVTDTNSSWENSGNLYVGYEGCDSMLSVTNGGLVGDVYGYIGYETNSLNNSVIVTGADSVWSNRYYLSAGTYGSGNALSILAGGRVENSIGMIGRYAGSTDNRILVSGAGTLWANSGSLYVGQYGSGNNLQVSNAGTVSNNYGYIGYDADSVNNSATVSGMDSVWVSTNYLSVGCYGSGNELTIADGGCVEDSFGLIGRFYGANSNEIVVSGSGSCWTNTASILVGNEGKDNSLVISNGGWVVNSTGVIGKYTNSDHNVVWASGSNSVWKNSSGLLLGEAGMNNSLMIRDGALVQNNKGYIGYYSSSSNNTATVSGADSVWINAGYLSVGCYGSSNSLTISDGGLVKNNNGYLGYRSNSSNNTATVSGTNSIWYHSGYLCVGCYGSENSLAIRDGGCVKNSSGFIGGCDGALSNSVLVSGATWTNSASLLIGSADGSCGNSLMVCDDGLVYAAGATVYTNNNLTLSAGQIDLGVSNLTVSGTLVLDGAAESALTGNLVMQESGVLNMAQPGSCLMVSGNVTLGGTLEVSTDDSLAAGDSLALFNCTGTISGEFSSLVLGDLDEGLAWDTSSLYSAGILQVAASSASTGDFGLVLDGATLRFDTTSGLSYTLQVCTNLLEGIWDNVTNVSGSGSSVSLDSEQESPSAFYRVIEE